jgi:DNA-binding CsgD family transcriptional regulator
MYMPAPAPHRLVGRDPELTLLHERLVATLVGHGGLVLVGGEAGIGKTTLADAICLHAMQQGALVLTGRCFDLAETPPYGPWIDLCARYPARASLPALPPAFAERGTVGAVASQMALFVQVQDFLTALALTAPGSPHTRPLVILLDDLHWADPASLDLLRFLLPTLAASPLLILATYRSDELGRQHPLYEVLPLLVRDRAVSRLDLPRLDDAAVEALVAGRYALGESDLARLVAYLQSRAEGNPLYLGELLRTLEEAETLYRVPEGWRLGDLTVTAVPVLLRQVIDARARRLDGASRRLLGVAAVIGHEVPLDVWAAVGEADEDTILRAVEQGLEARLLVETSGDVRVRFAHALVRAALYEGIPGIRRRRLHRQVGERLATERNPDPDAVAYHFGQDGDARTATWLVRAGERAQGAAAWLTAAARFQAAVTFLEARGIEEGRRGWLLYRIALLSRYAYPERAVSQLEAAQWIARATGDRVLGACAATQRGVLGCAMGDFARGLADMRTGVAMLDSLPESARARLGKRDTTGDTWPEHRGTLAVWLAIAGHFTEALTYARQVLSNTPVDWDIPEALYGLGFIHTALGRPDDARRAFVRSRERYAALGDHYKVGITALQELAFVLRHRADERSERQRLAAIAEAAWVQATGALDAMTPRLAQLPLLYIEGRWDEAHALALAVVEGTRARWSYITIAIGLLGLLARHRGDPALAWRIVREELPGGVDTRPGGARYPDALALQELAAALATDAGDLTEARVWLQVHDRWIAWSGVVLGQTEGHLGWAAYYRAAGDADRAHTHAGQALACAGEPRQLLALLAAHRLLGEIETDLGLAAGAETHLQTALDLADACAAPFERALTLVALATLRAGTGDTDAARTLLVEARSICDRLGALPAIVRADALRARLDATRRPVPANPVGLTAREVDVLRLLASGRTNREIAENLSLSPATVGIHVTHILAKTDCTNRTEAAALAHRLGLA